MLSEAIEREMKVVAVDPAAPVFQARGLTKIYRMGEVEVHGAARRRSRPLRRASWWCCSGPSGSGKSTLLNILGGLDVAHRGQRALPRPRSDARRRRRADRATAASTSASSSSSTT